MRTISIDCAIRLLKTLGWSIGDFAYRLENGAIMWQVTCRRDEHTIIGRAETQMLAWNAALSQAAFVQRHVPY